MSCKCVNQLGVKTAAGIKDSSVKKLVRFVVFLWEHRPPQLRLLKLRMLFANGADEIDMCQYRCS